MKKTIAALALVSLLGGTAQADTHRLFDKVKDYITDGKVNEKYFTHHYITIPNNKDEKLFYHREYNLNGGLLNVQYVLIYQTVRPYDDTNIAVLFTRKPKYYFYDNQIWNDLPMDGINGNEKLDIEESKEEKKLKVNGINI